MSVKPKSWEYRVWTADDEESLRTLFGASPNVPRIAASLDRTENSVRMKLARMGLTEVDKSRFVKGTPEAGSAGLHAALWREHPRIMRHLGAVPPHQS